jgi:iron complex transport system substrate-binding protein
MFCGGHWTPEIIEMAGATHPLNPCRYDTTIDNTGFNNKGQNLGAGPSFTVPPEDFVALDPDVIVVACCGFDIPRTNIEMPELVKSEWWKGLRVVKEGKVWVVDGNQMFNRPGPRLVDALEWLVSVLHDIPEICPPGFPVEKWEQPQD